MYTKAYSKSIISGLVLISIALTNGFAQTNWLPDFYGQAGYIQIKEAEDVMVGSIAQNDALQIGLNDVAQYMGHVCPGIASGFMLTKIALKELFGNETPERGNIRIAANAANDLVNVAVYVVGIRPADMLADNPDLVIDSLLKPEKPGKVVLIFQRKDNGNMVKAVCNKMKLVTPEEMKIIKTYKQKFHKGQATAEEIKTTGPKIQAIVKRAVTDTPQGVFNVEACDKYSFPKK
jgi:formylmethanofuran dehydrogenase subunit E